MLGVLLGAWLTATVAIAQPTAQPAKPTKAGSTKPAATKPSAGPATAKAGAAPTTTVPKSATAPARPLPEHSLRTKLQSDNSNPNYRKEKALSRGIKRDYTPRRTASGARPDTMSRRKP